MRQRNFVLLAAVGVLATSGVASAQQPQYQPPPVQQQPQYQLVQQPTYSPGAVAATPVQPTAGATVIRGSGGCSSCGTPATTTTGGKSGGGFTMSKVFGGNCPYGYVCQNGCGSLKSDFAFQFGTCSQFFSPCGPTCGGLYKKCGTTAFANPYGPGFQCPRPYDAYNNH